MPWAGEPTDATHLYQSLGEYQSAIEYHTHSLTIKEQIGDIARQGSAWNNLGVVYEKLKRYREALICYLKALPNYELIRSPYAETTRNNIAEIHTTVGEQDWPALEKEAKRLADDADWRLEVAALPANQVQRRGEL